MEDRYRKNKPTTLSRQSSPGIGSLWLHFLLSNVFAISTAGCCDVPWRYSSWIQHCVITRFVVGDPILRMWMSKDALGLTSPCKTIPSWRASSIFCSTAVFKIPESTKNPECQTRNWSMRSNQVENYRVLGRVAWIRMSWSTRTWVFYMLSLVFGASFR